LLRNRLCAATVVALVVCGLLAPAVRADPREHAVYVLDVGASIAAADAPAGLDPLEHQMRVPRW
jgi:hypothetical protein